MSHIPETAAAEDGAASGRDAAGRLRRLFLALVLLGMLGIAAELVLLEHVESATQWIPLAVIGVGLAAGAAVAARPGRGTVRLFQGAMAACLAAGALGVYLHYRGNVAFEREMDDTLRGFALLWAALHGATPALAPGALAHLGLIGLATTYRHPALRRPAGASFEETR
ncbi:MAG TPA: hypothetical protein VFR37_12290 [Longimicrobium sp.]|nr:hypothetical protein [Longimicrobium sp.]